MTDGLLNIAGESPPKDPEYRNPVWANPSHTMIDVELHVDEVWLPFTATQSDIHHYGKWVFEDAVQRGGIKDYPAPPSPTREEVRASMPSITRRQLRLTLVRHGITLPSVSDAIDAMPEGLERDEVRIEWDDGTTYERLNPRLNAIANVLGLTQDQVDAMWDAAVAA